MKQAQKRGSVLMELMVVFPIYLVLFGSVFMIGNLLIHAMRLPSAERLAALDLGRSDRARPGWTDACTKLFRPGEDITDERQNADQLSREAESAFYADTGVAGPFSVRAAMKVKNAYAMSAGGSRGQLAYANWFFNRALPTSDLQTSGGAYETLISSGRANMYSKSQTKATGVSKYFYYTLKRHRYQDSERTWRDNRRAASDLMVSVGGATQHWMDISNERYHESIGDQASNRMRAPVSQTVPCTYVRFGSYANWSN